MGLHHGRTILNDTLGAAPGLKLHMRLPQLQGDPLARISHGLESEHASLAIHNQRRPTCPTIDTTYQAHVHDIPDQRAQVPTGDACEARRSPAVPIGHVLLVTAGLKGMACPIRKVHKVKSAWQLAGSALITAAERGPEIG
eukprot:2950048-Alexandrium_andersonii.AAC.1